MQEALAINGSVYSGSAAPASVLIVDDERDAARELADILVDEGHACVTARDGKEAINVFRSDPRIHLVVADVRMPVVDGLAAIRAMRREPRVFGAIFMSGHGSFSTAVDAVRLDAVDFLTKPVAPAELIDAVSRAYADIRTKIEQETLQRQVVGQISRLERELSHATRTLREISSGCGPTCADELAPGEVHHPASGDYGKREVALPLPALSGSRREVLRRIVRMRAVRRRCFAAGTFHDPKWEILTELLDARFAGAAVSVSSLCHAAGVPETSALRRIHELEADGLIARRDDPHDRRRCIVELTEDGFERCGRFLDEVSRLA